MESKRNPRKKKKSIPNHPDNTALTIPSSETITKESSNTVILERERWCSQPNNNNYEKVRLSLGPSFCVKKEMLRHGFFLFMIIFMISVFFIWAYTLHKVNNLEDQVNHIERQILTNIKSIKEHHNSTFRDLEEKHNELRYLVNTNSLLIASSSWNHYKNTFQSPILLVLVIYIINILSNCQ